ncbi:AAA family ATPase [Arthrobacter sp. StoSoilB22]|uniref:ATP-dependent nuclease n=1 Tax=Arthrobacter sp. StoSoilB22 TaxID=2830996 RepID=UPI001CC78C0F|nr:AAA family ATPase [Arthrobacter sp. StoSoilB22]
MAEKLPLVRYYEIPLIFTRYSHDQKGKGNAMKLVSLQLCNFQSFGASAEVLEFANLTYLLGPNGSGKTALLQALARMFGVESSLRRVRADDFHVTVSEQGLRSRATSLWIEAEFAFPQLGGEGTYDGAVPPNFRHILLDEPEGTAYMRIRLSATIADDGEVEQELAYVAAYDSSGMPTSTYRMHRDDRALIQVHYLPARRDPADHIAFGTGALMGKLLKSADWDSQRAEISTLTDQLNASLSGSGPIADVTKYLTKYWSALHQSDFHKEVQVSFAGNSLEDLFRYLTIGFGPGHSTEPLDYSLLSDGQKSLLYLSLVLTLHGIGQSITADEEPHFDLSKLRPPIFTFLAVEEPENSLSPHYLGRVIQVLREFSSQEDGQCAIATHSASMLRRTPPEDIRYLRLSEKRATKISHIVMPKNTDEGYKFVREAVQAFPELYFSRLVVLGEGDSEEIVLPRLLQAHGVAVDDASVSVVPLGGKHVNHFWRLLDGLGIPYLTLLDLDLGRNGGGWGRLKTALAYLELYPGQNAGQGIPTLDPFPSWNSADNLRKSDKGQALLASLEGAGVFFSEPLDLDFSMLMAFPNEYGALSAGQARATTNVVSSVLGGSHGDDQQYSAEEQKAFHRYHGLFKLGSKPAAHLEALSALEDSAILTSAPQSYLRLVAGVMDKLRGLPE